MEREEGCILVVGANGLIGSALVRGLQQRGIPVAGTSRREETDRSRILLDLGGPLETWEWSQGTTAAVLCAGITRQEACRQDPVGSARVNVVGTVALAQRLVEKGVFVVFLSSSQVFDGSAPYRLAREPVCPTTEYGRQKAAAEHQLLALGRRVAVVRFAKILGPRPLLLKGWKESLERGEVIHPFADMVMAPVGLDFAVEVLWRVASLRLPGILQVSACEDVTYAQVGRHIAQAIRVRPELVQPARAVEAKVPLEGIPVHTTLDVSRLVRELGLQPPAVWAVVDRALEMEQNAIDPLHLSSGYRTLTSRILGPEGAALT